VSRHRPEGNGKYRPKEYKCVVVFLRSFPRTTHNPSIAANLAKSGDEDHVSRACKGTEERFGQPPHVTLTKNINFKERTM